MPTYSESHSLLDSLSAGETLALDAMLQVQLSLLPAIAMRFSLSTSPDACLSR